MRKNIYFVLLLAMLLTFTSCEREATERLEPTHTPVARVQVTAAPRKRVQATATPRRRVQVTAAPRKKVSTSEYYQRNFPMTYGYIRKNADNPEAYIRYYDSVWGTLQRYRGDGIPFDTLTSTERALVNYPIIGKYVYFSSSTSNTYHSIKECYSLLKSENIVSRPSSSRYKYSPCSKCVDE